MENSCLIVENIEYLNIQQDEKDFQMKYLIDFYINVDQKNQNEMKEDF